MSKEFGRHHLIARAISGLWSPVESPMIRPKPNPAPQSARAQSRRTPLKILYVVAEAFPLVKTGGLGDVAGALPQALMRAGLDVRLMLPAYAQVMDTLKDIKAGPDLGPLLGGHSARLLQATMPGSGVPVSLVDCPALYDRGENIYQTFTGEDWPDNHLRFGLLSRAAALVGLAGQMTGWRPDVLHANDWHTGLVPYYLHAWGGDVPRSVFTIHNIVYQGLFEREALSDLGIPGDVPPAGLEFWGRLSFLKAGLIYSDRVTAVSPTYAREVQTAPFGEGMEGVISARRDGITGIVNGIDETVWNPAADPFITRCYDADSLDGKAANKTALAPLGLEISPARPVIGVVSRLVEQKGIDLVLDALPALLRDGVQLVVLGTGDAPLEDRLLAAAAAHPGQVASVIGYDERLAHRIIAGADMILMPSRFEPCGLTQLYGQRYGSLPVVHKVGGLADTVHDMEDGFSFKDLSAAAVARAVKRAVAAYRDPKGWRRLQKQAMAKHSGWDACAKMYVDLYEEVTALTLTKTEGNNGTVRRAHHP
jgi:starch synthase